MKTLAEIRTTIQNHKETLASKFFVKEIAIFGSYVRETQKETSDVDLLVDFDKRIGFFKFIALNEYLEEILGVSVDLVSRKALKPRIGKRIQSEMQVI